MLESLEKLRKDADHITEQAEGLDYSRTRNIIYRHVDAIQAEIDKYYTPKINDDSTPENVVTADVDGSNDGNEDSREKLEADISRFYWEHENELFSHIGVLDAIYSWLDRHAAITEREFIHSHPICGGSDTCHATNLLNSESVERETPQTAENATSKDEIRDFDVWSVAYEIYCAGGWVDNGNEPNPPTDGIWKLLDRQSAITADEEQHVAAIASREAGKVLRDEIAELQEQVNELIAENAHLKGTLDDIHENDTATNGINKRLLEQIEELKAERDKLLERKCPGYDADTHTCNYHAQGFELNHETLNRLKRENAKLSSDELHWRNEAEWFKGQFRKCLESTRCDNVGSLMSYPLPEGLVEPYQMVTDAIYSLRDFYADDKRIIENLNDELRDAESERDRYRELWIQECWHCGYQQRELARFNGVKYPPLTSKDGKPIHRGQTLYGEDGQAWKIDRWDGHYLWSENDEKRLRPEWLTHESPDSLASVVSDLRKLSSDFMSDVYKRDECGYIDGIADRIEKLGGES